MRLHQSRPQDPVVRRPHCRHGNRVRSPLPVLLPPTRCARSAPSPSYVKKQPGVIPVGSLKKGQKVTVTRYSPSGRFAQIVARAPGYTVRGWVPTRYLCS